MECLIFLLLVLLNFDFNVNLDLEPILDWYLFVTN